MTTDYQRTPIAKLVANSSAFKSIDPDSTDDAYLAITLMILFRNVCADLDWKDALGDRYIYRDNCLAAIQENRHLAEKCVKTLLEQENAVRLAKPPVYGAGLTSAIFAWEVDFVGEAHTQLLSEMRTAAKVKSPYRTITQIVQSSGVGKSRTVDELAKCIFTIPICLRHPDETGYPHGDARLWTFFKNKVSADGAQRLCIDLLASIIREVSKKLQSEPIDNNDFALGWYQRLKPHNGAPSPYRKELYASVYRNFNHSVSIG
ncbi:hypothetical protein M0805_006757 [Coniferiporia weirii]|nr:hypothetical protein M0805_006757 [Coniferiporia weirii]